MKFDESNFNTQANANINFPSEDQDLPNHALNYSAENGLDNKLNGVVFQDNNNLEVQSQRPVGQKQRKKRRRRRKPRQQIPGYGGYIGVRPLPGAFPPGGNPYVNPGYPGEFPLAGNPYVNSGYPGQYQRELCLVFFKTLQIFLVLARRIVSCYYLSYQYFSMKK